MSTGLGVMIGRLSGNSGTVDAVGRVEGKKIVSAELDNNAIILHFDDCGIKIWDDGQSCCEDRYMSCDDDLSSFVGADVVGVEIADADNVTDEYGEHEIQFLNIRTSVGVITAETHNEHNGYYGGFLLRATLVDQVKS